MAIQERGGGPRVVVSTAAFHARVRGSVPGLGGLKETKFVLPHPRVKVSIVGSLRDREVACSASDRQGSHFASCVWRAVSSQSSHHPQEVLLAQFSLYVHKGGLKPDSFHFYIQENNTNLVTFSNNISDAKSNKSKGFCQVKTIQKIREKLESGWLGQDPTRIIFFWGEMLCFFVFFVLFSCFQIFKKKKN